MSMLTSKQLVIDRFGDPTDIVKKPDYDEYYYNFGVFEPDGDSLFYSLVNALEDLGISVPYQLLLMSGMEFQI